MDVLESFNLKNKTAIVTGGYGHLGAAMVISLYEAGAKVIVCAKDKSKFEATFKSIADKIYFQHFDISDIASIKNGYEEIFGLYGSIDILINNAVYSKGQIPELITDEEWSYTIDGVLNSVFRCIREVIPFMQKGSNGNIINISSMYGVVSPDFEIYKNNSFLNPPHYGASKAAVIQLTKYFANYLAKYNIRVNAITPGAFPSKEVQQNIDFIEKLSQKTTLKRIGNPEDLKGAIVFLASNASSYITGQNLIIDGGWTIM